MYVCICNAVTEKQVRAAARDGARSLWDLQARLGVAAGCGTCLESAMDVLRDVQSDKHIVPEPRIFQPSAA